MENTKEHLRIVAAAVILPNGLIVTAPPPARHHTLVNGLSKEYGIKGNLDNQGFLLSNGQFVQRRTAGVLALKNGQLTQLAHPPYLYSEDLW